MEDCSTLASDCVVISCCCQCLILQMIVFVLLKLPYKLVHRAKQYYYARIKKLRQRRKRAQMMMIEGPWREEYFLALDGGSKRIDQVGGFDGIEMDDCGYCFMEEIEKVMEELSHKGEFAFGSFWGKEGSSAESLSRSVAKQEFDLNVVQFHLIEMGGSNY